MTDQEHGTGFNPPGDDATLVVNPGTDTQRISVRELRLRLGLPEGDRLEDYGDVRTIGIGGMGAVFSGHEPGLMREVALKMLRPAYRWIPERISAFIREARTTAQINHPNIIPVYRVGVFEGAGVYFSMKRVQGRTLRSILSSLAEGDPAARRRFTLRRLLEIFISACNGVSFAHHRGVVHCDLKPANLMVGEYGEVLVMDWGMAQYHESASAGRRVDLGGEAGCDPPDQLGGTPAFMAPELLTRSVAEPDEQTDVYSLGAILYTILTWRTSPFPPDIPADQAAELAARGKFPAPRRAANPAQDVPRELEAIALKAMSGDRSHRYASVSELLEDLHNYLDGYPVGAYSPNPIYRLFKWIYRRPAIPAVGMAALLTWFGFTAVQEIRNRTEAESLLNLAAYNYIGARSADAALRRDYRLTVVPRLAESVAGERIREDLTRQQQRAYDNYTAALELLARVPESFLRQNARAGEMYREIFRGMTESALMSRDDQLIHEILGKFRSRWPGQFEEAMNSDSRLRRMVETIDAGVGGLEVAVDNGNWMVEVYPADETAPPVRRQPVNPGETLKFRLVAGNYRLEFTRSDGDDEPVRVPVRVPVGLTMHFRFDPPAEFEDGYAFVTSAEEMDSRGDIHLSGGFLLGKREVTIGEFLEFWRTLPPEERNRCRGVRSGDIATSPRSEQRMWDDAGNVLPPFSPELPVSGISGHAAESYCRWLGGKLNRRVRLPREWEWRRAARGVDRRPYPWGEEYRRDNALLADATRTADYPNGAPPGSYPGDLSPCGVFDLAGNVREFVRPSTGDGSLLMVMGGSYLIPPQYATIDFNQFRLWTGGGDDIGFRCLIDLND